MFVLLALLACSKEDCPEFEIENGRVDENFPCDREKGEYCYFRCDEGFKSAVKGNRNQTDDQGKVQCTTMNVWGYSKCEGK